VRWLETEWANLSNPNNPAPPVMIPRMPPCEQAFCCGDDIFCDTARRNGEIFPMPRHSRREAVKFGAGLLNRCHRPSGYADSFGRSFEIGFGLLGGFLAVLPGVGNGFEQGRIFLKFVCEGLELRRVNVDLYFRACGHIESFLNPSDPPHQATNVFFAEALSLLHDILRQRVLRQIRRVRISLHAVT
jgi:hypothetical protein